MTAPSAGMDRRYTLLLGFGQLTSWGLTFYVPAISIGPVAAAFGTGAAPVMGAFSLALLLTGLASPAVCRRIDAVGGRGVLLMGTVLQAAGLLVMAGFGNLLGWYLGWAITGCGMAAGLYDAAFATTGRALGAAARPTITGITMIGGFASTVGWPLGAALIPLLGWRGTLVAYAVLLLGVCGPLYLALPRSVPPPVPVPAAVVQDAVPAGRALFLWVAAFFTLRSGINTVVTVSAPVMLAGLGIGPSTAIGLVALIGPAQVAMRVVQSVVGRRWSPMALTWISALLLPVAMGVAVAAAGGPLIVAAGTALTVGYGASNGILTIARGTLPLFLFGAAGYATRIGRLALPVLLAQAAAPVLSAPLLSAWTGRSMVLLLAVLATVSALLLVPVSALRRRR